MDFLLVIFKIVLFFISNMGFWNLVRKSKMNIYFIPLFVSAGQIFILFFAGIFNLLGIAAYALYLSGIVLFIVYLCREKLGALKPFAKPGFFISAALLLTGAVLLKDELFNNYDNFSHWALVVKEMLRTDQFPNFTNPVIEFKAYPLGSSSYIYYFAKCVGDAEYVQMLAQFCLEIYAFLPLFGLIKKHKILSSAFLLLVINYVYASGMYINDLAVDTLLPLYGMAVIFFIYKECFSRYLGENSEGLQNGSFILCTIPLMAAVVNIKNSGIFFILLAELLLLKIAVKNKAVRKHCIAAMLSPILIFLIWKKHCDYVFVGAAGSMHAMTVQNYLWQLRQKSAYEIVGLCKAMAKFSVSGATLWLLLLSVLLAGVFTFIYKKNLFSRFKRLFIIELVIYVLYMIGMLFMYIFSMPTYGQVSLAASDRYQMTIFTAMVYLFAVYVLFFLSELEEKKSFAVSFSAICLAFVCFWGISCGGFRHFFTVTGTLEDRNWLQSAIDEYDVPEGRTYTILLSQDDYGYMLYLGRYLIGSPDFGSIIVDSEEALEGIGSADYIFIKDPVNEIISEWCEENYPEQRGNTVILASPDGE